MLILRYWWIWRTCSWQYVPSIVDQFSQGSSRISRLHVWRLLSKTGTVLLAKAYRFEVLGRSVQNISSNFLHRVLWGVTGVQCKKYKLQASINYIFLWNTWKLLYRLTKLGLTSTQQKTRCSYYKNMHTKLKLSFETFPQQDGGWIISKKKSFLTIQSKESNTNQSWTSLKSVWRTERPMNSCLSSISITSSMPPGTTLVQTIQIFLEYHLSPEKSNIRTI